MIRGQEMMTEAFSNVYCSLRVESKSRVPTVSKIKHVNSGEDKVFILA